MASRLGYRVFLRHHAGWESQGPRREPTHRVVVGVQVGHEHGSQGAQDPVHTVPIVAAQLPTCAQASPYLLQATGFQQQIYQPFYLGAGDLSSLLKAFGRNNTVRR